ncbi:pirin family protein [Tenacibaculum maritimum]|uniref:pirin family protein n=1 Tax=Tenacibaculum maritimum TaxID=107401 RepID=UPI00041CC7D5|nr:pirin family protein [Tenacibaculum maritimum]MCD9562737.1 pirin family protein [Tenacibaculum maritimum]MCD9565841.1 pirin family protein [Tenacibaculum maritimum]MCD9579389.1 pirin family protein [Tenacibaculum maritimum]MCD9596148.1 pirin family protein [Tenacibaculum maritimum]MCD9613397.1 pirin family protein [Tenacibaculum maritimum]
MSKVLKGINYKVGSPLVNMGVIKLRQPLPNKHIENIDPFLLLHHYGPYVISEFSNPFDVGAHPHRGFEPITMLFKGEQLHRDSLGNEILVKEGDVQWITAGRGIIHSEGPSKAFIKKGGELEGIQLWLNLPATKKMIPAGYQHIKNEEIPFVENEEKTFKLKVVAGKQQGIEGRIKTQTEVNVFILKTNAPEEVDIDIPVHHASLVYLLEGEALINGEGRLKKGEHQMISFNFDGNTIRIKAKEESNLLILSGEPIKEKIAQYGPYVMNTQTEIMEAMRDFQQGKMGYLY